MKVKIIETGEVVIIMNQTIPTSPTPVMCIDENNNLCLKIIDNSSVHEVPRKRRRYSNIHVVDNHNRLVFETYEDHMTINSESHSLASVFLGENIFMTYYITQPHDEEIAKIEKRYSSRVVRHPKNTTGIKNIKNKKYGLIVYTHLYDHLQRRMLCEYTMRFLGWFDDIDTAQERAIKHYNSLISSKKQNNSWK